MSHDATNWAIKQRGIKPALKVVLWHLCDRYNPDMGCFPSQETLAEDCEVPRSTLNVYLGELERVGLIAREQRRSKGTKQQERTRYYFPFEAVFEEKRAENPCPETGHGSADPVSRNAGEPSPENGESRVQNLDSNPVREPVNVTSNEREGARAASSDLRKIDPHAVTAELTKRVQAFCTGHGFEGGEWKGWGSSTIGYIAKQFAKLSPEERDEACAHRDAFLAKCQREKVKPMPAANYFRDRIWAMLSEAEKGAAGKTTPVSVTRIPVAPFGPVWAGLRQWAFFDGPEAIDIPLDLRDKIFQSYQALLRISDERGLAYLTGKGIQRDERGELLFPADFEDAEWRRRVLDEGYPEVTRLHNLAKHRERGSADARAAALAALCEPVPVGSDLYEQWRRYHAETNRPFVPDPGTMPVVYFPKGGPDGLQDFERAARAVMTAGESDEHAA